MFNTTQNQIDEHADSTQGVEEETSNYSKAVVGRGASECVIIEISKFARDAQPKDVYSTYPEVPFIYEILTTEGWSMKVKTVVDAWVENEENIKRVAKHVKRKLPESTGPDLVRGFCLFKLKATNRLEWKRSERLGVGTHEPQAVVFLALEDLSASNGFFITLKRGFDVCVDSKADIRFPPTGGGLGIYIALNV